MVTASGKEEGEEDAAAASCSGSSTMKHQLLLPTQCCRFLVKKRHKLLFVRFAGVMMVKSITVEGNRGIGRRNPRADLDGMMLSVVLNVIKNRQMVTIVTV
jgi:hypothetical protein